MAPAAAAGLGAGLEVGFRVTFRRVRVFFFGGGFFLERSASGTAPVPRARTSSRSAIPKADSCGQAQNERGDEGNHERQVHRRLTPCA